MTINRVTTGPLSDGEAGTVVTLKTMAREARRAKLSPPVYTLSRELIADLPPKDWVGEVRVIYEFVRDRIRYVLDPVDVQGVQTPEITLELRAGNCAQKVTLLGAMLLSIGHPVQFCAVRVDDSPVYTHVVARTWIGNHWLWLETTEGPIPMGDGGPDFHRIVQPMKVVTV